MREACSIQTDPRLSLEAAISLFDIVSTPTKSPVYPNSAVWKWQQIARQLRKPLSDYYLLRFAPG